MNLTWIRYGVATPLTPLFFVIYGVATRKPRLYGISPRWVDGGTPPYAKYSSYVIQYVCVRIYCILYKYFYIYNNFTYGVAYGVAPRKPRLYKKLFLIWDCTPYGGLRGRAPVIHFTDQVVGSSSSSSSPLDYVYVCRYRSSRY